MEKVAIKQVADYIKDLEEGLDAWDYRGPITLGHLTKLHQIIRRLMDATYETDDQELKPLLATLEYKARGVSLSMMCLRASLHSPKTAANALC